ncbi:hypothetical protein GALMADRAFT_246006 [Galerina marginata CBS 339.88]|uniref:Uncharacterized protein n=1 Tax=Galerina marginata (strain CBS 339.88) TaxID=685588 RepID=A0A067T190_GALM3|nr:hypothetical protein GALMADRAFT_246006 [Galerina marginata CBS 339.88]
MDSRPPPPQGAPPSYAFVTRVYRRNLRPIVISFAFIAGIWALFSGIGFFRNVSYYNTHDAGKLGTFSIVLGALYMGVFAIELFGIFAASSQKLPFVRLFAYLSGLVTLVMAAIGLLQVVIHFTLKTEIINTCTDVTEGDTVIYGSIFGPVRGGTLSAADANNWCNNEWNRGSWSNIIAFLITTFLAAFFAVMAFGYLRQVLDPAHPANVLRGPASHRMGNFPSHYNPPYNPSNMPYGGGPGYYPSYPAPAGPPPNQSTDAFVPPYDGSGKPPGYIRGDDFKGTYGETQKGEFDDGPSERDIVPTSRPFH